MNSPTLPPSGIEATSPLAEAKPESLDELFSRDPLSLSDSDVDQIVDSLRAHRRLWAQEEKSSKKAGTRTNSVGIAKAAKNLKLEDLKLDLEV